MVDLYASRNAVDFEYLDVSRRCLETEALTQNIRTTRTRGICARHVDSAQSWEWLPIWFNKAKNIRIVIDGAAPKTATTLERIANTRGLVIDCSAPTGSGGRYKFAKFVAGTYGQNVSAVNLLLHKTDWQLHPSLELLEKLALLNQPLTSATMERIGVVIDAREQIVKELSGDNAAQAMATIPHLAVHEYTDVLAQLSSWLDKLVKVKGAVTFMKDVNKLAFEVGEPRKETETLMWQSRRFDYDRINKIALSLASADRELSRGNTTGVMEALISRW